MNPRVDFDADSQPHFSLLVDLVYQLFAESEIENVYFNMYYIVLLKHEWRTVGHLFRKSCIYGPYWT